MKSLDQKQTTILAILALLILMGMASCKKSNDVATPPVSTKKTVVLYSSSAAVPSLGITISLAGVTIGGLNYSPSVPDCGDRSQIVTSFEPGTYTLDYTPYRGTAKKVTITVPAWVQGCAEFDLH